MNFRLFESMKNALSRTFFSSKLFLESWILHCLRNNFPEYSADTILRTFIIVDLIPQHFSWFINYKLLILKLIPGASFATATTIRAFVDTLIYCSWWRWWPKATHASNFVTSSKYFLIEFIKRVIEREISGTNSRTGAALKSCCTKMASRLLLSFCSYVFMFICFFILLSRIKEYRCLKNVIHQIDSKIECLFFSASFTAQIGFVFVS